MHVDNRNYPRMYTIYISTIFYLYKNEVSFCINEQLKQWCSDHIGQSLRREFKNYLYNAYIKWYVFVNYKSSAGNWQH